MPSDKINVLLELRPALEGFAGIPQEVRLLFRGLRGIDTVHVEGLLQTNNRELASGTNPAAKPEKNPSPARLYNRYSKVIISFSDRKRTILDYPGEVVRKFLARKKLLVQALFNLGSIKLSRFESKFFEDFTWRTLFAKTLPASDFSTVATADHRICSVPWTTLHEVGADSLAWSTTANYPRLDTSGFDVFIGQTPYPGRVAKNTVMVIRYHDAIPIFMPQVIPDKAKHQATHMNALSSNVKSNAWFACVSEASRQDLLRLFPEAAERSTVIHNLLSPHYFLEDSPFQRVPAIIRTRLNRDVEAHRRGTRKQETSLNKTSDREFRYLMAVSTIEPRKNHIRMIAAWEALRADVDPELKLVIVGTLGWDNDPVLQALRGWIKRGEAFMLSGVPAADLRILYRHASATVCPSLAEGFDFSGVEAMRCGGVTIASDIPAHREVYEDAAEYFDAYSTGSALNALKKVLYEPCSGGVQARMRTRGQEIAARYQPDRLLPQWVDFLSRVTGRQAKSAKGLS